MDVLFIIAGVCCILLAILGLIGLAKKAIEDIVYFWAVGDYGWCFSVLVITTLLYSLAMLVGYGAYLKVAGAI